MEPSDSSTQDVSVPWDRLRAWIDGKEAFEKEHGRPAPLSRPELEALSLFISFDDGDEPADNGRDYVSDLHVALQARRLPLPVFVDDQPLSVPIGGRLQPKWRCMCSVTGYGRFPCLGYGVEDGKYPPAFLSKKTAKRYAAKYALQCLQESRPVPAPKRPAAALTAATARQSPAPKVAKVVSQPRASDGPPPDSRASSPGSDREASVFTQVSSLAARLGIDSPSYMVAPDDELPNFFRGRPVFAHPGLVPPDVGVVSGVLGKRQARAQVAEKLLEWLKTELRKREATFESMFSRRGEKSG